MMAHVISEFVLWLSAILDLIVASFMIWVLSDNRYFKTAPMWHRVGFAIMIIGLLAQSYRSFYALHTGHALNDSEFVFWVFKDLGIASIAGHYAWLVFKIRKESA